MKQNNAKVKGDQNILLKVLTKLGTIFGHFAWTKVDAMKTRGILCSKRPFIWVGTHNAIRRNI
jgi:hypothetical protein